MKHFCSFSEAIREGAKLRPQGFGMFFSEGRTCAFGAGKEAVAGDPYVHYDEVYKLYPYLNRTWAACPECLTSGANLSSVIYHLNDDHKLTREAIADWLESEEEKLGFVTLAESEPEHQPSLERQEVTV